MKERIYKIFTALTIGALLFNTSVAPVMVYAEDAPTPPTAPTAPAAPTAPTAPETPTTAPTAPPAPTQPASPTGGSPTTTPTVSPSTNPTSTPTPTETKHRNRENTESSGTKEEGDATRTQSTTSAAVQGVNPTPTPSTGNGTGSSEIKTGDATNGATIATNANTNGAQSGCCSPSGATVANTGNGSDSQNNGSATTSNNNTTNQNNTAVINSNLTGATVTGKNDSSNNVGDSSIKTGDSNTSGTIITTANTNVDGVMVSEFNIVDDHQGDYVLDFAANCVQGCGTPATAINSGNGSGSNNTSSVDLNNTDTTFQNNDAAIGNTLVLSADSGNNQASQNTGGNSDITTGDANIAANALTFANNNFAGNVLYGTVNIYGDLVGDIILTEEELAKYGITSTQAANTGNGSGSQNNASVNQTNSDETFQNNEANILNSIVYDAETGNNEASGNTGGDTGITTGDTNVMANVLNIANSNIAGGNMWLVLVNQAGKWVGKLMGAPEGSLFAGSEGVAFNVGENGEITASNGGNGSDSTNNANVSETNTNTTVQNNVANIENKLDLSANTGGNTSSDNTGGDSKIKTGDANIIANIVNFVNNNVSGNGKLVVTVVNVFGSWIGDFVTPGHTKEEHTTNTNTASTATDSNTVSTTTTTTKEKETKTTSGGTVASRSIFAVFKGKEKKVLAAATQGAEVSEENGPTPMVKGSHYEKSQTQTLNSKIKINLAWFVILLPIALLIILMKKVSTKLLLRRS